MLPALTIPAIEAGRAVRIVAFGSSSTAGVGASAPALAYPAQLQALLRARHPAAEVEVINKGIGGETVVEMAARLDRDVLSLRPNLVVWQVGTNDILRSADPQRFAALLAEAVGRIRGAGSALILMDPQPFPREGAFAAFPDILDRIRSVAAAAGVPVLPRYAAMRHWIDSGRFSFETMLSPDGLHMTDASYACLAELVARALAPAPALAGVQG